MSHCHDSQQDSQAPTRSKPDWLLRVCATLVVTLIAVHYAAPASWSPTLVNMAADTTDMMLIMWWGIALGMVSIGLLRRIPREFVTHILGSGSGLRPVLRATCAGVLLDMCSHGILMVGAQLYERGASIGQVVAFLLASPWNSLSLTLILLAMLGPGLTVLFVLASMLIGIVTGVLFDGLARAGRLPANPHRVEVDPSFDFWPQARLAFGEVDFGWRWCVDVLVGGVKASRMVVRWLLFGVLLAVLVRAFVPLDWFATWFGPTLVGLLATVAVTSVMEVCSEGSTPLAVDFVQRAGAPGNGFAFLMGGVATDYTEVMVLKDTTSSWRVALFLPLLTLPQVLLVAWLINSALV